MRTIKKFESFSTTHREPTKVSFDEWLAKYDMYGLETFTQKELDFFLKLKSEKNIESCVSNRDKTEINIELFFKKSLYQETLLLIDITKLKDDWYLIRESCDHVYQEFYICDEWDEVLGYLESNNLKKKIGLIFDYLSNYD